MSKDLISIKKDNVEIVDKILDYCITTLEFWGYGEKWPTNLIKDSLEECKKILNFVSRSHINDKYVHMATMGAVAKSLQLTLR